nr:DUF6240 domain-containing protein [Butyrivibrio sp.]
MSINFQAVAGQKADRDVILSGMEADGRIMASPSKGAGKESEQVVATLNGSLFSDNTYAKHARSAEDINNLAQNTDVAARHNFMALLSNTLSEEDYSKAMENGFDLKDLNSEDTVNIVDKIKGALLTAGVEIAGFNDDLSAEKLQKITGSDTLGRAIANSFHENDVPVTPENVRSAKTAYEQIADITSLGDSSVKYMVLNNMSPTIENVYFAAHSTNGRDLSGRGFYAQETGGYYAQKADSYDWEQLDPQINKVIEEAGCSVSDTAVKDNAKWMVEQGIPLTAENLTAANTIKNIKFPISEELAAKSVAAAVSDGKRAIDGDLSDPVSNLYRAAKLVEETNAITDDNLNGTIISGKELTIRNMSASYYSAGSQEIAESDERLIKARIQLEEVRLVMTTRSNKFLLDSGYSIDTAPME